MRHAVTHLKRRDPVLREIIERVGPYRIQYAEPDFETLARSIVFQQLSGASARAIFARLKTATGAEARMTPAGILSLSAAELRWVGLSQQKSRYLGDLAEKAEGGIVDLSRLASLPDAEVIAHLTAVRGIGVWTAQMYLLFALRRQDVLAAGDLGIRAAIRKAYGLRRPPTPKRVEALGEPWRPYRSVACWYLWRSTAAVLIT
jgi:DNA-3-methyladenine glycosylase II